MPATVTFYGGFRDLVKFDEEIPTKPDEVSVSLSAKRLAVFKSETALPLNILRITLCLKR